MWAKHLAFAVRDNLGNRWRAGITLILLLLLYQCVSRTGDDNEQATPPTAGTTISIPLELPPDPDAVASAAPAIEAALPAGTPMVERSIELPPDTGAIMPIVPAATEVALTGVATIEVPIELPLDTRATNPVGGVGSRDGPARTGSDSPLPAPDVADMLATELRAGIHSEPVEQPEAAGPAPFVDQYLSEDDEGGLTGLPTLRNARTGRRFFEAELIYYDADDGFLGGATEKGILTRWRQETLNWGEFDARLIFSDVESDFLGNHFQNDELYFTLRQSNAPLDNGWLMNNAAGHQRTLADPFLHSGYRIRLPTSLFLGASMGVSTPAAAAQWYMGKTGDNRGIAVPQFRENGGDIFGGSWRRSFSQNYMLGAEVVNLKGHEFVRDHTSLLMAGSYARPDGIARYDMHLLTDDETNIGVWADSRNVLPSDMILRYGGFYLEPDLAWMDNPIVNDQYGGYIRADKRTFLYNYSLGYDYTKLGLANDGLLDANFHSLFLNGNYRVTRKLSLGANANVVVREFHSTNDDNQLAWRLSNFVNYRFVTGTGRAELYTSRLTSNFDLNNNDIFGTRISYDWNMPQGYRLTTEAAVEEQRRLNLDSSNQRLNVLFRQSLNGTMSWGLNTSYYRDDHELLNTASGLGINADARWQFLPDWYVSASIVHNQTTIDASSVTVIGGETEYQSDAVWLRLGYATAAGQPFRRYGRNTQSAGSGRIRGEVFYDENHDFIRQPGERPAVGVVVIVDNTYEVRTDAMGRYEFNPVYPGTHRVSLITEDLPLPWGLDDEAPRRIEVGVRQATEVDFSLVEINGG